MSDIQAVNTAHTDAYECDCGDTHRSALARLYCLEQIEADERAARRPVPQRRDTGIIKAYD